MPFIPTADEWLTLSAQLLEARPTTTRVTTKYSITPAKVRKARKSRSEQDGAGAGADTPMPDATSTGAAKPPRAKLILKTFCPRSGVCLKYKTSKAAEVGRLVQMLGSLGRNMSGMPALPVSAAPAVEEDVGGGAATPPVGGAAQQGPAAGGAPAVGGGGGGEGGKGKKKKKGKR